MCQLTRMVYIASPYTCTESKEQEANELVQQYRYDVVTAVAGLLEDIYGYAFICPITQSHNLAKYMKKRNGTFAAWKTVDLTFIFRCDEVWVVKIDGWNRSVGVLAEIEFAKENGKIIKYVSPDTLEVTPNP